MKVALDTTPLANENKKRGVGSYTSSLLNSLGKIASLQIVLFANGQIPANVDLIHYPYFDFFFHTLPIRSVLPRVVTIHDAIPLVFPDKFPKGIKGSVNLALQKLSLKNTQAVICDSNTSKRDIFKTLKYPPQKIYPVYLAADALFKSIRADKLETVRKKHNLPKKFILYVGDVNWNKNISSLLRAAASVDTDFVLVGPSFTNNNLKEVNSLKSLVSELKIESKIHFLSFVPTQDLVAIYNLATATCLPSFYEGFGLPMLESMACAAPVVCSNNSSLVEIGSDVAIYIDPRDPADIAAKIKSFLDMPESERRILKDRSFKHAQTYSWEKTAAETIKVYKKISGVS